MGDNALLKLAPALERLRGQPPLDPTLEGVAFVAALTGEDVDGDDRDALEAAVERLRETAPEVTAYLAEPMLRVTLVPTMASASSKENVIPSSAELLVDCRVPPGMGPTEARERAQAVLGEAADGLELTFKETVVGNRSSADSPLASLIEEWLAQADPAATLVPIVMAGFSDSHWFREAFDSAVVYGFCPQRELALPEAVPLVHGADERAAVADIDLAARFYLDIVQAVLA
jgi:acetylornithine deacetylase/succinyl-diaminopimelate desuccinylase-like protein